MKSILLTTALFATMAFPAAAQFDMLGKDLAQICARIDNDPEYEPKIDTLDRNTILVLCRGAEKYPYFSYEIDIRRDECVCVGVMSRNREVFDAYLNVISSIGTLVEQDSARVNFKYLVYKNCDPNSDEPAEKLFYSFMQPYHNSNLLTQRNIFIIALTKNDTPIPKK